jgi:tetratricopeptide (TPR) repeat protein
MAMNSTGANRCIVACVSLALLSGVLAAATDCGEGLSAPQKISKFKELDAEAEQAVKAHHGPQAVRLYRQAVCLAPNSPRGYYGLGMAQAEAGDFAGARDSFRTADRLQPTTAMPLVMQVRVNFSLHDLDALKANLREIAERFPRDAQVHDSLARFLAERNLLLLALAESLRAEALGNRDPSSKVQLAVLENTVGAYDDAIRNALAVTQDETLAGNLRASAAGVAGLSYESLGEREQAIEHLRKAIQLDPSQENSYLALADLFEQSQRYPEAVDILQAARRSFPESPEVLLPLGADLIRAEHYQAGDDVLHELLRSSPQIPEAYISIADASHKLGNTAQEIDALHLLAQLKPDYPMIHVLTARAMLGAEPADYRNGLNELLLAEKETPGDPDVFYLRGKAYFSLGKYDDAITALRHAIELRPTDPGPYYQLAKAYQKLGKTELAKEQFDHLKYLESAAKQ